MSDFLNKISACEDEEELRSIQRVASIKLHNMQANNRKPVWVVVNGGWEIKHFREEEYEQAVDFCIDQVCHSRSSIISKLQSVKMNSSLDAVPTLKIIWVRANEYEDFFI